MSKNSTHAVRYRVSTPQRDFTVRARCIDDVYNHFKLIQLTKIKKLCTAQYRLYPVIDVDLSVLVTKKKYHPNAIPFKINAIVNSNCPHLVKNPIAGTNSFLYQCSNPDICAAVTSVHEDYWLLTKCCNIFTQQFYQYKAGRITNED